MTDTIRSVPMVTNKSPYHVRLRKLALAITGYAFLIACLQVAVAPIGMGLIQPKAIEISTQLPENDSGSHAQVVLPQVLTEADQKTYAKLFEAQRQGDWQQADQLKAAIHNDVLLGHVLAERYLHASYAASADELNSWLNHYQELPQALRIYEKTVATYPDIKETLAFINAREALRGIGDNNGLAALDETPTIYASKWKAGLQFWKTGHKVIAAKYFAEVANYDGLPSPWLQAAASYWAYRSYDDTGQTEEAQRYLHMAAQYPRSFYGILARKTLGEPLQLDKEPLTLTDNDILAMVGDQSIRRVIALSQIGNTELAEKELRLRFPLADAEEKLRLLALAHDLGLASVQISMAKYLNVEGRELDFARYPMPHWKPQEGFKIDPLLIYALVRQESGFHTSAVSPDGAIGLMQLMPKTASYIQKKKSVPYQSFATPPSLNTPLVTSVFEPMFNVSLGQHYVEHLFGNRLVDNNLIYMLVAYNAGAGRLQEWKNNAQDNDPLLFVEEIPIAETKHYVMQVMANYWIYSEMAGASDSSAYALLKGNWPIYSYDYARPIAAKQLSVSPGA